MPVTTIERQAAVIERWKAKNGITGQDYVRANSGARRTEEKRALLSAIAENAARLGMFPPFKANYCIPPEKEE